MTGLVGKAFVAIWHDIVCRRPSQALKSPTTETRRALGAHTAKSTPRAPSCSVAGAPRRSERRAGERLASVACAHPAGFFEGRLAAKVPYRLLARRGADEWLVDDPYAYGPVLGPMDDWLLVEGTHTRLYDRLGAHAIEHEGARGVHFAVWAPNARRVSVVRDFNAWDGRRHAMRRRVDNGVWEIFVLGLAEGTLYKYEIVGARGELLPLKADPVGCGAELRPSTVFSIFHFYIRFWDLNMHWLN